jgi:hypothetical protein
MMQKQARLGIIECPECGASLEVFPSSLARNARGIDVSDCKDDSGLLHRCRHVRGEVANLRELASANAGLSPIPVSRRLLG